MDDVTLLQGDNRERLSTLADASVNFIYIDPPFRTGKMRKLGGHVYADPVVDVKTYQQNLLIEQAYRLLKPDGSMMVHADMRAVYDIKPEMDRVFGRKSFLNEIIWVYDYGARSKSRWSCKHDTILWYAKDPENYTFNFEDMERIPYMAPGLVGKEKAERGKTLTDVWWHTIVPTNGSERVGYPTQKPLGILRRIVSIHTRIGDTVLDYFAGSGTTAVACKELQRKAIVIDNNPQACEMMKQRLQRQGGR